MSPQNFSLAGFDGPGGLLQLHQLDGLLMIYFELCFDSATVIVISLAVNSERFFSDVIELL